MNKKCKKHGMVSHFLRKDGSMRCGKCASDWVVASRRRNKEKLVKMFGGGCSRCGYSRYSGALDFHHKIPDEKSFSLSVRGLCYSWETVVKEAKICVLLCKNCHSEVESKTFES